MKVIVGFKGSKFAGNMDEVEFFLDIIPEVSAEYDWLDPACLLILPLL